MSKTPNFDAVLDTILADLKPHTRTCAETGESFDITERDIEMFRLLRVPPPKTTWWARMRRKHAFDAAFELFRRTAADGAQVISMYDPESPLPILSPRAWHADDFAPLSYGRPIDPTQPFFGQWDAFSRTVPRPAIVQDPRSENSDWSIHGVHMKNCYSTSGGLECEDLNYADSCGWSKHCTDITLGDHAEWAYDAVRPVRASRIFFSDRCEQCVDMVFSLACRNCSDCFGCTNLRNKRFCFLNEQLTEEEYRARIAAVDLSDARVVVEWKEKTRSLWAKAFRRAGSVMHSERAYGDEIENSVDAQGVLIIESQRVFHTVSVFSVHDALDVLGSIYSQWCVNSLRANHGDRNRMVIACEGCIDVEYSELLISCEHCFGCIGLKHKKFCIFNKQYSEEEYWLLVDAIKTAMLERGEYGEFFPYYISPFAYNNSYAGVYFPLQAEGATRLGARWYAAEQEKTAPASPIEELPHHLKDVTDDVLTKKFRCPVSGRAFGIVKPELEFHRELCLALPRVHPTVRRLDRMERLLTPRLYSRDCDSCGKDIETRLPPTHTAPIFCGACYEAIVMGEKALPTKK